jgi:hypothetical protein
MYKRLTLCFVCLIAFISISLGSGECVRVEPVTFGSEKCEAVEMTAAPFDHTGPFDYKYDDGLGGLSLSSPVADLCEALRIQAEHACSVTSVEFYIVRGGSLEIHIWDVDTLRFPASHELITPFIEEIDSSGYGGWEEIMLPSPIYLPPLGECVVGRKIIEPFRPVVYLSRMEDIEERSFLYIPSSHQWLRPNYADTTRSWNVTYLIRAHGWYYYVPDEYIFELDTSIVTSTNHGVALCDCDGDLDADLATGSRLYRNDSGTYNLVTGTGISGIGYPFWGDFDLNGKPDIFFCADSTMDKLYANGGSGSFYHDVTTPAGGMSNLYNTEAAAWLDYDKDGDLDIYVANSSTFDPADSSWTYYHDLFYRNEGAYFTEYTDAAGIGYAVSPQRRVRLSPSETGTAMDGWISMFPMETIFQIISGRTEGTACSTKLRISMGWMALTRAAESTVIRRAHVSAISITTAIRTSSWQAKPMPLDIRPPTGRCSISIRERRIST